MDFDDYALEEKHYLIRCRHDLREYLGGLPESVCTQQSIAPEKSRENFGSIKERVVFHIIKDSKAQDEVRRHMRGLVTLHKQLEDQEVDFRKNRGLWLPVVADQAKGDTQVNVTCSPSWGTRTIFSDKIGREMVAPEGHEDWEKLAALCRKHQRVKVCRDAGMHYRVTVRGENRGDPEGPPSAQKRDLRNFHEFIILLGDIVLVLPSDRYRSKRKDAWKGVVAPEMTYHDHKGTKWWVYPAKGKDDSRD